MATYVIIHGCDSSPEANWFPWLKDVLEKRGHTVHVPQFPIGKEQNLEGWLETLDEYAIPADTIFVGHSVGVCFIMNWLEEHSCARCIFVAGFIGKLGLEFDHMNETFAEKRFAWETIKLHCPKIIVINSDADPYVPLETGIRLATNLGTECHVLNEAGHINADSGFTVFEEILDFIDVEE